MLRRQTFVLFLEPSKTMKFAGRYANPVLESFGYCDSLGLMAAMVLSHFGVEKPKFLTLNS